MNTIDFTSATLSTEIISFSVSVNVVKKPFSSDTTGAAYDRARPTCSRFFYMINVWVLGSWNRTIWKDLSRRSVSVSSQPTSPGVPRLTRELLWKVTVAIMAMNRMIKPANNWTICCHCSACAIGLDDGYICLIPST